MNKKNKFEPNSKYFTISIYTIAVVLVIALIIKLIFSWESVSSFLGALISTLSPFLIGILFAFLINPLVNWIRCTVLEKWLHIKRYRLTRLLSIFIAYIIVLGVFALVLVYLIPELVNSLKLLVDQLPSWASSITNYVTTLGHKYPNLDFNYIQDMIKEADSSLQSALGDIVKSLSSSLLNTGVSIIRYLFNVIVAVIVSCYMLIDKNMQARSTKRIVYALLKEEHAKKVCSIIRRSITIFSNFFDGKMIDSLIIGFLCFVSLLIISFFDVTGFSECAVLVSIVVGITNMIPYFGPFIGGIPSVLLLCIYSPKSALIFAILIIIIQQLDGNVIGPKILGDSTGLRPLWIIFAITLGGWLGGVAGMLLGVPCVAVISGLLEDYVNYRLSKKQLDMPIEAPAPKPESKEKKIKKMLSNKKYRMNLTSKKNSK